MLDAVDIIPTPPKSLPGTQSIWTGHTLERGIQHQLCLLGASQNFLYLVPPITGHREQSTKPPNHLQITSIFHILFVNLLQSWNPHIEVEDRGGGGTEDIHAVSSGSHSLLRNGRKKETHTAGKQEAVLNPVITKRRPKNPHVGSLYHCPVHAGRERGGVSQKVRE